jgi:hypothetical protein
MISMSRRMAWLFGGAMAIAIAIPAAPAQDLPTPPTPATPASDGPGRSGPRPIGGEGGLNPSDFPTLEKVTEGFEKVVSTADGKPPFYTIWVRRRDGQMLAELPRDFARQKHFIALTIASGETYAGLQAGDLYAYWKQYDKRLALIKPNVGVRSNGDNESKSSVKRLFTDRVVLDVPILTIVPRGGPVIDMDELLVGQASKFFGAGVRQGNPKLATIQTAKAFPDNVELAFEMPMADGRLQTLHYSFSLIPDSTGYSAREADERVGFFTTGYSDLGKFGDGESRVRYINRWHLQKADPSLKVSPPKEPIVFYLEHTTPVRYRRWVRQGVLFWNKAFERVGLANAIEVYYQDATSGAHMDKDPEDVRYNFIRWLNNNVGTAIGPSRTNPLTGQILDADIILTDGWIRSFWKSYNEQIPQVAMEGFGPEALAWFEQRPQWDPRVLLAPPSEQARILADRARRGPQPLAGHPLAASDPTLLGDDEFDGLFGRHSQSNGCCMASSGKSMDVAMMHMHMAAASLLEDDKPKTDADKDKDKEKKDEEKDKDKKPEKVLIDGMPEDFIGPLLADLVAHEVGHTLGLRHNFKASGLYTLAEINSAKLKGQKAVTGSVMDYNPVNINLEAGELQGDYTMIDLGPYDLWAIEYGYTFDKDLKPILARVAEPELAYATDEDTIGPDPLARRYDFSKDPLDYAKNQLRLAKYHRARLLEKFVKDGESWSKARRGYEMTLRFQTQALSMMSGWVGGAFVNRDRKGDKNGRAPLEVVPAAQQRAALNFIVENAFEDGAFGLTPELLTRLATDHWSDGDDGIGGLADDSAWPIHDRILGIQASALSMLMNPTTMKRVYDNEFRIVADQDAVTLPEVLDLLTGKIWGELDKPVEPAFTTRKPMISSLRRSLQREHLERLIDLTLPQGRSNSASKAIANLSQTQLASIKSKIDAGIAARGAKLDPYSKAHLQQASELIGRALEAQYIYNTDALAPRGVGGMIFIGNDAGADPRGR